MPAAVLKLLAAAAPAEPDAELLARFVAARDDAAFAELVRRHGPAVYHTCRRLVGPSSADDAFQATFLVFACRAGAVRKAASVGSWLVGVAGRVGRRMGLRDRRQETGDRGQETEDPGSPSPVSGLLSCELRAALSDEFSRLPDRLRAAAVACLVEGRTQEQAAAALGWSDRTVRRRLDEAKTLLRDRLERRGVAPAAVAAALAAVGEAGAVPPRLLQATTDAATLFLAGGGNDLPAAALAHGVLTVMTTTRTYAAAACAAVVCGLGVGWAGARPDPAAPPKIEAPAVQPERIAPPAAAPAAKKTHTHTTANFVVEAPTEVVARTVGAEFERRRKDAAVEWLGKELPAWKEPVRVKIERNGAGEQYAGHVRFRAVPKAELEVGIGGTLEEVLTRDVRQWTTQFVLATHLAGTPPRWAWDVLGFVGEDDDPAEKAEAVRHARRALDDGRALRLAALFKMTAPPKDTNTVPQSYTVASFLLTRRADGRVAVFEGGSIGKLEHERPLATGQSAAKTGLLTFLLIGRGGNWEAAAKDVYGFASLADLERAWIDWVRAQPVARPDAPDPDRIPAPAPPAPAATERAAMHTTANFAVTAPTADIARRVGDEAEAQRAKLARAWLGKELPKAPQPVPVRVVIAAGGGGGATTFTFGEADGKRTPGVTAARMELRGPTLDSILKAALPHEVMHVVLATHFGRPLPRWADEGLAVLAESADEQRNHDIRAREMLNVGRAIRLSTLFRMTEYPRDSFVTFAQGYSVCRFLLTRAESMPVDGRGPVHQRMLLAFVEAGMANNTAAGWDAACRTFGFDSVDALEAAWIDSLRKVQPAR